MSDPTTERAETTDAGATGAAQTGAATQAAHETEAAKFTQEDVNRMLADEKRKLKQQQHADADRIKREAEEKAALEKGEFEKLAQERGTRLAQAEADLAQTTERLTLALDTIDKHARTRLRALPEEIKAMAPEGDALAVFAWLDKAEAAAAKLGGSPARTGAPDINAGARGGGGRNRQEIIDAEAQRLAETGRYSGF